MLYPNSDSLTVTMWPLNLPMLYAYSMNDIASSGWADCWYLFHSALSSLSSSLFVCISKYNQFILTLTIGRKLFLETCAPGRLDRSTGYARSVRSDRIRCTSLCRDRCHRLAKNKKGSEWEPLVNRLLHLSSIGYGL